MKIDAKIFVAGHGGLVGSAIVSVLKQQGYTNLVLRRRAELDLTDQAAVRNFFLEEKPEYVFMAAAKVGGIEANNNYPADFGYENQAIQNNIIHSAWKNNVNRLIFLSTSCSYPRDCPQPICEEYLLTGPLELTNKAYAIAKISGASLCDSFNMQYNTQFLVAMPTNLYGPNDNYDLQNSHVMPALMRKIHEAKVNNKDQITVWGTGIAQREFMHSEDLADALIYLINLPDDKYKKLLNCSITGPLVNIGCGKDISIKNLVDLLCSIIEYKGEINWDTSKPDGTPKKLLNCKKINEIGWQAKRSLKNELNKIYQDKFYNEISHCRNI